MHSTDTQVVHRRATCTENEQSLDLPFDLLSQCLLHITASTLEVQLTGSKRAETGNAETNEQTHKTKKKNPPSGILGLVLSKQLFIY